MSKLTVWHFHEDMETRYVHVDGERGKEVHVIAPLEAMKDFYRPTMRCINCNEHFDPKAISVALNDSVLIPCLECESVIRRKYGT